MKKNHLRTKKNSAFVYQVKPFTLNHRQSSPLLTEPRKRAKCKVGSFSYRPKAYDVTEGRPRVLGVKRGTVTCAIAKHEACRPPGPGPRTDWEAESANALLAQHVRAARQILTPQHGVIVMETWRQCIRYIPTSCGILPYLDKRKQIMKVTVLMN